MKKLALLALCAAGVVMTSGCMITNMGTLQEATKPIEQGKYTVLGDRVSGVDSMWILPFGISDGRPGSAALRALDEAKAKCPTADALVEVSQNVETYLYPIPLFPIMQSKTRVTGTPVKIKD